MERNLLNTKRLSSWLALVLGAVAAGCSVRTPPAPSAAIDAFAQNRRLGRGVNIGNALDGPSEGEWGVVVKEEYFDLIKQAGFQSVRIPVRWSAHADAAPPYAIHPAFLGRVDEVARQALARDLAVVIDMHHYMEIGEHFANERPRFLALWRQIARHFRSHPPELMLELLNEPSEKISTDAWNELAAEALAQVRAEDPCRTVIVGTTAWGGLKTLGRLVLPEDDRNLIVTWHCYDPFEFTHQGAEWIEGAKDWVGRTWGTDEDRLALATMLDTAEIWGRTNRRPIYLGEFGAYDKADQEARLAWISFVAREAEARGMSWAYWDFCTNFGVYDRARRAWRDDLLKALLNHQG